MGKEALSSAFSEMILEEAKKDKNIMVVCTDSRGSAKLGAYPDELPEQFVEMGIAEQNSVTVSAGMAYMGKKVFTIGPASFYSMRSAEQVKVDIAYSHNNVTVIGISGGISYGALGATHHSLQDISLMRAIPGLTVMIPSDAVQMRKITKELLESPRPTYIRIARSGVPVIYDENTEFKIGKAKRLTRNQRFCSRYVYHQTAGYRDDRNSSKRMRMYPYTGRTQYLRRTWRCSCRSCSTDRNGTVRYLWNP